jgi:hypothetical protein
VTLSELKVDIKDPNEELLLETSENYTLTIHANSAILEVFDLTTLSELFNELN